VRALALPRRDWAAVAAGAVLVALAYPPFHLFLPSYICLVPAVRLILEAEADPRPLRRLLTQGFWFGLLSNALVLYWMIVALWHFTPLSALGYAATIAILAAWTAGLFAVTGWVRRRTGWGLLVVFPVFWTAMEWVIGHQGDVRFPWLGLGTSLTHYPVAVQIADLIGARGVGYLLVCANTALALASVARRDRRRVMRLVGAVLAGTIVAVGYGVVRMRTLPLRPLGTVAVIQPNVGFDDKWRANGDSLVDELIAMSAQVTRQTRPRLTVWPEAAVPGYFIQHPDWEASIRGQAAVSGVPLVVGGLDARRLPSGGWEYFNAAFVYDGAGEPSPEPPYHKNYLVPIVERVPFVNPRWFGDLKWFGGAGIGERGPVYTLPIGRFGILICYESIFEDLSRRYRRLGADFLVNITNDAWYGNTSASYQHPAHLVMRAIETRAGIVRAANDGISEFVDPLGREHQRTIKQTQAAEAGELMTSDAHTLYVALGDWVGLLSLVAAAALVGGAWSRRA
jgi:apolipoprotein N-acyltransferase